MGLPLTVAITCMMDRKSGCYLELCSINMRYLVCIGDGSLTHEQRNSPTVGLRRGWTVSMATCERSHG